MKDRDQLIRERKWRAEAEKRCRPHAIKILEPFIGTAFPYDADKDNRDGIDIEGWEGAAGFRVFGQESWERFKWIGTIRSKSWKHAQHTQTNEFDKIMSGKIGLYLYGYEFPDYPGILQKYQLINIDSIVQNIHKFGIEKIAQKRKTSDKFGDGAEFWAIDFSNKILEGVITVLIKV